MKAYFYGTGRRKNAVARLRLIPGDGRVVINGKPMEEYLSYPTWQVLVQQPLVATGLQGKFDVLCNVDGGGISGQAGAIRHGVARALLLVDPEMRKSLKKSGFLTRDPRMKERKKYGLKKARKRPQFSKR